MDPTSDNPALGDYLADWLELQRARLQPSTWESYRHKLDRYVLPRLAGVALDALTPAQLTALYAHLLRAGSRDGGALAPRTVQYAATIVHAALGDAVRLGLVERNVADRAIVPRRNPDGAPAEQIEPTTWSGRQLRVFLDAVASHRLHPLWVLAAGTGMRRGELLGLRWTDVDLDDRTVRVCRALSSVNGKVRLKTTKTSNVRNLTVDERTVGALRAQRRRQQAERDRAGDGWADAWGLVFTRPDGRPLSPASVSVTFRRLVDGLDLPRVRLHDLRHSHASLLLAAGVPLKVVSQRLGHARVSMTLDTYAHALPAHDAAAADAFGAEVWGESPDLP